MSVGPPAGNPTTTRTGRFGYPCASDGATPASSNRLARIPCKKRIESLSLGQFLVGAIIGEGALRNKGKTPGGPSVVCRQYLGCRAIKPMSLLRRHARCPHVASVLVQNRRDDLSAPIAFKVELRVDDLVKELVLGAGEDR
jgi:hypothetical protein